MQNSTIQSNEQSGAKTVSEDKPRAMSSLAVRKRQEMSKAAAVTKEKEEAEVTKTSDGSQETSKSKCEECG